MDQHSTEDQQLHDVVASLAALHFAASSPALQELEKIRQSALIQIRTHYLENLENRRLNFPSKDTMSAGSAMKVNGVIDVAGLENLGEDTKSSKPFLVVLGGPSGVGKSTLFSLLAGEGISPTGVLRPTTTQVIAAAHPDTLGKIVGHPLEKWWVLHASAQLPAGLVIIDTPDLDRVASLSAGFSSIETREADEQGNPSKRNLNKDFAFDDLNQLLVDVCDAWIFVTNPTRYGDARAWDQLVRAKQAGAAGGIVLNRASFGSATEILPHLYERFMKIDSLPCAETDACIPILAVEDSHNPFNTAPVSRGRHRLESELEELELTLLKADQLVSRLYELLANWQVKRHRTGKSLRNLRQRAHLREQIIMLADSFELLAQRRDKFQELGAQVGEDIAAQWQALSSKPDFTTGALTNAWVHMAQRGGPLEFLVAGEAIGGKLRYASFSAAGELANLAKETVQIILCRFMQLVELNLEKAWQESGLGVYVPSKQLLETGDLRSAVELPKIIQTWWQGWRQSLFAVCPGKHEQVDLVLSGAIGLGFLHPSLDASYGKGFAEQQNRRFQTIFADNLRSYSQMRANELISQAGLSADLHAHSIHLRMRAAEFLGENEEIAR